MEILLINIPPEIGKKPHDSSIPFVRMLNFGLLSIASYVKAQGYDVAIFDPYLQPKEKVVQIMLETIKKYSPLIVGLSCISGYCYLSCKKYAFAIRQAFPSIMIIVGGKDHVGHFPEMALSECPSIDVIVIGEGEVIVCQLINSIKYGIPLNLIPDIYFRDADGQIHSTKRDNEIKAFRIPCLNYDLYPDFNSISPCIEVGRGCSSKCDFCSSSQIKSKKKSVPSIIKEARYISKKFKNNKVHIYFQTPKFMMNNSDLLEMIRLRKKYGLEFTWRTSTRVEYLANISIPNLFQAGLRVVDVGLESGSSEILLRMKKTPNPQYYLRKAADLLRVSSKFDLIIKLNILFYLGESFETIKMTLAFLEENRPNIKCVSAYPLILYPGSSLENNRNGIAKQYGSTVVSDNIWQERHVWPMNISNELTNEKLQEIGFLFSKSFQTMADFFKQKQYGYISQNVSYHNFVEEIERLGIDRFPFSRDNADAQIHREKLWELLNQPQTLSE